MQITLTRFSKLTKTQWSRVRRLKCGPNHESYINDFIKESDECMLDRYCIICEDEDIIKGWIVFENFAEFIDNSPENFERLHIFVEKKWRRQGIGAKLLDAAREFATTRGFNLSGFYNQWSEKLYKKFNIRHCL